MIARDIPNWQTKNYAPKNPLKWYEVYRKYKKEQEEKIKHDEEVLRQTMMGLGKKKEGYVPKVVDLRARGIPKLPMDPRMRKNNGGAPLKQKGFKKEGSSFLNFTAGSKTKLTDGSSVLMRARREAIEIARMSKLSKPTHQLRTSKGMGTYGTVLKAPAGMVKEYQVANQPAVKILSGRKSLPVGQFEGGITGPSLEEREKRLKAMQSSRSQTSTNETLIGSSSDEEDDLFDEDEDNAPSSYKSSPPQSRPTSARPYSTTSSSAVRPLDFLKKPERPGSALSAPVSRTASLAPAAQRPMMAKRRPEVDVFNRGAKKPRMR